MGAETQIEHVVKVMTPEEAKSCALSMIDQAAYDYGHAGYTGSFAECRGVEILPNKFASYETAEEFLVGEMGICEKWGPMLGVQLDNGTWVFAAICSS